MNETTEYPQTPEPNEYHHIDPHWLDDIAIGLTAGAAKYPGEDMESDTGGEARGKGV